MMITCSKCGLQLEGDAAAATPVCPRCGTAAQPSRKEDLLDAVLSEVRKLPAEEVLLPKPDMAKGTPRKGVFAKPKRERTSATPYKTMIAAGAILVILAGYFAVVMIQRQIADNRVDGAINDVEGQIPNLQKLMEVAQKQHAEKDFAAAAKGYEATVHLADDYLKTFMQAQVENASRSALARFEEIRAKLAQIRQEASGALDLPEIKFSLQGLVEFEGKWITPDEKERLFANKMAEQGRTLYNGEWLTETESRERKGERFYEGRWVSAADYAKLTEGNDSFKPPEPKPAPTFTPPPPPKKPGTFDPADPTWVLSDFEKPALDWTPVNWGAKANPCTTGITERDGSHVLVVTMESGANDKCGIMKRGNFDFTSRSKLMMSIYNATGVPISAAIAFDTADGVYYEGRWKTVGMKDNPPLTFDLKAGDFKRGPTWSHDFQIRDPSSIRTIYILFYTNLPGEIYVDNIVALGNQ